MKLYQRGTVWWISYGNKRASTKCADRVAADLWAASYERSRLVILAIDTDKQVRADVEAYFRRRENEPGWVYGIRVGAEIKIGFTSNDPVARVAQVQTHCAGVAELVALLPGTRATERGLHRDFKGARVRGEWFSMQSLQIRQWIDRHMYTSGTLLAASATKRKETA